MKRNTDRERLKTVLRDLRTWADLESRVADKPEALKVWQDVCSWAEGAAQKNKINLDEK